MKTHEFSALLSVAFVVTGTIWAVIQILQGNIRLIFASWVISGTAIILSAITYWTSSNHSLLGGALNISSILTIWSILIATYYVSSKSNSSLSFSPFQKNCLIASAGITVVWLIFKFWLKKTGFIPNILTQLLMIIAYTVNIQKVWRAEAHSESTFLWWCVFIASFIALYTAHAQRDVLSWIYAIRSTGMCGLLLYALHRIESRK